LIQEQSGTAHDIATDAKLLVESILFALHGEAKGQFCQYRSLVAIYWFNGNLLGTT